MAESDGAPPDDAARLEQMVQVLVALAANDLTSRVFVGDGSAPLDGLATGINMLADELDRQQRTERLYRQGAIHTERLALVGRLTATVAHEINNPAASVLANLEALHPRLDTVAAWAGRHAPPPEVLDALAEARAMLRDSAQSVERVAATVRDLRAFSHRDGQPRVAAPVDMAQVVEDARRMVHRELAQRARLTLDVQEAPRVHGDHGQLVQVLVNLLVNAAHAIPATLGPLMVGVSVRPEGDHVVTRVTDDGTGVRGGDRAHLLEALAARHGPGVESNLGLAVCQEITHQHGGTLTVESTPGQGTTVVLVLPRQPPQGPAQPHPPIPARAPCAPATRARVLLVDDERHVLDAYRRLLARDVDVVVAEGGEAAVRVLMHDRAWDLVLCDMMMPDLDGASLFGWVSAHAPQLVPRMAFCTGGTFTGRTSAFLERPDVVVLAKPFQKAAFLDVLARVRAR